MHSVKLEVVKPRSGTWNTREPGPKRLAKMEALTSKATRRSTRIRVEIPISVTSLDRMRPFADRCVAVVVSGQGCGFRSPRALQLETPIFLSDLPGGGSVTARVASCLPLGNDGKYFLIGAALYTHGNVWGISDPPEDWGTPLLKAAAAGAGASGASSGLNSITQQPAVSGRNNWPYNRFADGTSIHVRKK